jgi:hypothetical protein
MHSVGQQTEKVETRKMHKNKNGRKIGVTQPLQMPELQINALASTISISAVILHTATIIAQLTLLHCWFSTQFPSSESNENSYN